MAKKKKNKTEKILQRADKLFNTENFLLAEKEFEKISKSLRTDDVERKLEICRQETRTIKADDFIKQGYRAVKNDKLSEAVDFFQKAEMLISEPWLTDKIRDLNHKLSRNKIDTEARKAESSRDYINASRLYEAAWKKSGDGNFLIKSAVCLVKAEDYQGAAAIFKNADMLEGNIPRYYYGFALAGTGRYHDALKQWERIDSHDKMFLEQKQNVLELACAELYHSFEDAQDRHEARIKATTLLKTAENLGYTKLIGTLEDIRTYCSLTLIEQLWEQGGYADIADILPLIPIEDDPAVLALNAGTYYHLSAEKPNFLESMMAFWLTAVYSQEISVQFSENPDTRQKIQHQLIRIAEQHINHQEDSRSTRQAAEYLTIEKKLLQDMFTVSRLHPQGFHQVCTPDYAVSSGISGTILNMIRRNKKHFKNQEHYLETGGYYSRAKDSLYALKTGEIKKALNLMANLSPPCDEFTEYVMRLVEFEAGQTAINNNERDYLKYFASTPALFESAPSIEKRFSDYLLKYGGDHTIDYEKVLAFIYTKRQSSAIAEPLSLMMTESAIMRYNDKKLNNTQTKVILEKALDIFPDNSLAIETLEQTKTELEIKSIYNAISKHKLNKAAKIAVKSSSSEVYDQFFDFLEQIVDQSVDAGLDNATIKIHLHDVLNAGMIVDPSHPLIDTIHQRINRL